jgi:hypothetical protein
MASELVFVPPEAITPDDLALLAAADVNAIPYNKIPADVLVKRLWAGEYQLFRAERGVLLTELNDANGLRRMSIVRFAGDGISLQMKWLTQALQHHAKEFGCIAIETMIYSPKLAKAMLRTGAKPEATIFVLELD